MKRIKVLHLLTSLGPGGAETNLLALMKHFDSDRFEHAVAFGGGGVLQDEFSKSGVKLIPLSSKPISIRSLLNIPKMIRLISLYSPDVIHSHLDWANVVGLVAKCILNTKLVLHFHGLGIVPKHKLPGRTKMHWVIYSIAHVYRYCDKAIAICDYQLPFLKALNIQEDKLSMIPNGINIENDVHLSIDGNLNKQYTFINVARFSMEKNHKLLINAFSRICKEIDNVKLQLVGDGPLRQEIEAHVSQKGINNYVEILGVRRDVHKLLNESDCFVLSSNWELHPITILEAMRSNLPVIATDVGGVSCTVANNTSGILVKPENEDELFRAMFYLATNIQTGHEMGIRGGNILRASYLNEMVSKKVESIYLTLVGASQNETA